MISSADVLTFARVDPGGAVSASVYKQTLFVCVLWARRQGRCPRQQGQGRALCWVGSRLWNGRSLSACRGSIEPGRPGTETAMRHRHTAELLCRRPALGECGHCLIPAGSAACGGGVLAPPHPRWMNRDRAWFPSHKVRQAFS